MSYTVSLFPNDIYIGDNLTIRTEGFDASQGEYWEYGVKRDDDVWVEDDPEDAQGLIEAYTTATAQATARSAWLNGYEGSTSIFTVKVCVYDSTDTLLGTATATMRVREGVDAIPYTIDPDVAEIAVNGFLPKDTKRNNLYRLMFASGVNIVKGGDGNPHFTALRAGEAEEIDVDGIYNEGSAEYQKPYTRVTVLEHGYTPIETEDAVTLFDNTDGDPVTGTEVWFSQAPVILSTLEATAGLTINFATVNSAVVTGQGKLTGVPYTHETRLASKGVENAGDEQTVRVTDDATLVTLANSQAVLNRLYGFYCQQDYIEQIKNGIVFSGQKCGKRYVFRDPFGEEKTAFLAAMDSNASSFVKANCEFYAGYEPDEGAMAQGLYQHVTILDAATFAEDGGTWSVPAAAQGQPARVVLIGGGTGGSSGWPGKNGKDASARTNVEPDADISSMWYGAEGGDGGAGGDGGSPGKVKVVDIDALGSSYSYTIGAGGAGGAATGFIPDTVSELRAALENEDPDTEYTDAQIEAMIARESRCDAVYRIWTKSTGRTDAAIYVQSGHMSGSTFVGDGERVDILYATVLSAERVIDEVIGVHYNQSAYNWELRARDAVIYNDTEYDDGDLIRAWSYSSTVDFLVHTYGGAWAGTPNAGSAGTATTFGSYSSANGTVPMGGVYEPINGNWYALAGKTGIPGGKGGARKVEQDGYFTWVTDGEDVTGPDGTLYHGGRTGTPLTSVEGLDEANITAYGGNGAGAAVGLDRADHAHMDGGGDASASWNVTEDE